MVITVTDTDLLSVAHQLRQLAIYLEGHIPTEGDADKPPHMRRSYITGRSRTFDEAFAAKAGKRKGGGR
jgi:hypothetical protein